MVLKKLGIKKDNYQILDVDFVGDNYLQEGMFTSLLIGENGVGKSFLLRSVMDTFEYLEKAKVQARKPKFIYDSFEIEYEIQGNTYLITDM